MPDLWWRKNSHEFRVHLHIIWMVWSLFREKNSAKKVNFYPNFPQKCDFYPNHRSGSVERISGYFPPKLRLQLLSMYALMFSSGRNSVLCRSHRPACHLCPNRLKTARIRHFGEFSGVLVYASNQQMAPTSAKLAQVSVRRKQKREGALWRSQPSEKKTD
jgi:hypothetical protein